MRRTFPILLLCLASTIPPLAAEEERTEDLPTSATYVPVVASTPGAGGSQFVSLLSIVNPHPFSLTVTAYYLPGGADNRGFRATARPIVLPANGSTRINDPMAALWGASGLGTIYLESPPGPGNDGTFVVDSRLLNVANPNATYGLSVPATLSGIRASDRGWAADVQSDAPDSSSPATVRVEILAETGNVMAAKDYTIPPLSLIQDAVTNITVTSFSHASLRVTPPASLNGQIIGYVAVADNATSDAAVSAILAYTPQAAGARPITIEVSRYRFAPGGPDRPPIQLEAGVAYELRFHSVDATHGLSGIPQLGISGSAAFSPGSDYVVLVAPTVLQRGARFSFTCVRFCGAGHGGMYGSIEII